MIVVDIFPSFKEKDSAGGVFIRNDKSYNSSIYFRAPVPLDKRQYEHNHTTTMECLLYESFCFKRTFDKIWVPDRIIELGRYFKELYGKVDAAFRKYDSYLYDYRREKEYETLGRGVSYNPPPLPDFSVDDKWRSFWRYDKSTDKRLLDEERIAFAFAINHKIIQQKIWFYDGQEYQWRFFLSNVDYNDWEWEKYTRINDYFRLTWSPLPVGLRSAVAVASVRAVNTLLWEFLSTLCPHKNTEKNVVYIPKNDSTELFLRGLAYFYGSIGELEIGLPSYIAESSSQSPFNSEWASEKQDVACNELQSMIEGKKYLHNKEVYQKKSDESMTALAVPFVVVIVCVIIAIKVAVIAAFIVMLAFLAIVVLCSLLFTTLDK